MADSDAYVADGYWADGYAVIPVGVSDYTSLVTSEHQKPNFLATITALVGPFVDQQNFIADVPGRFDLDSAIGVQLDTVGAWAGISRYIPNAIPLAYFGFDVTANGQVFGEEGQGAIGARFYDEGEPVASSSVLADPEYRFLIRAKIAKNNTKGTNDDFLASLSFLFSSGSSTTVPVILDDPGTMHIGIAVGRPVTYLEKLLINEVDILPRPAGVQLDYRSWFQNGNVFGFQEAFPTLVQVVDENGSPVFGEDADGALVPVYGTMLYENPDATVFTLPFGEEGQQNVGGIFAEEF
jgi:hypothetical protein